MHRLDFGKHLTLTFFGFGKSVCLNLNRVVMALLWVAVWAESRLMW